jgi:hypothetical protein
LRPDSAYVVACVIGIVNYEVIIRGVEYKLREVDR